MTRSSWKQLAGLLVVGPCLGLFVLAAFGSPSGAQTPKVSFLARSDFAAGSGRPSSVAVADFNGDGKLDLVVANEDNVLSMDGDVSLLLGNGDGTFQAPRSLAAGRSPSSVAVGDFNGDGLPDLAVTNIGSSDVSVLLGNGDGTFQPAQNFVVGIGPNSVTIGDFNGDGLPDLVVADEGTAPFFMDGGVSVLLGNGDGTFQPAQNFAAGIQPDSVTVGDFNGDALLDLAVANNGSNDVSVLLGNGDGTFQPAQNITVPESARSVAVGDFNGDGTLDLVVANGAITALPGRVSILLGNGDGTFQPAQDFVVGIRPDSVMIGDFNGDGKLDLAVANDASSNVSVLFGNGDGTFQPAQNPATGLAPSSVAVGDFNGDGTLDLAVANANAQTASVLLGNGDGTFLVAPSFSFNRFSLPGSVAVGDFNGDGLPDLAVADASSVGGIWVLLGNGDGTFQPLQNFPAGSGPSSLAVGDFNGDGIQDLAVANLYSNNVSVLLGNGDGTFQPAQHFAAGSGPLSVAVGDFDGDGRLDVAVADEGTSPRFMDGGVSVLLGNGDGTLQPALAFRSDRLPLSVAVGDFNGDGTLDLAVGNGGSNNVSSLSILLGNGDGSFQPPQNLVVGIDPNSVVVGDFNGDGTLDLAVGNASSHNVSILLGNGDGTFQAGLAFGTDGIAASVAAGDFNGDGKLDLAVANVDTARVTVLINNTPLMDNARRPTQAPRWSPKK